MAVGCVRAPYRTKATSGAGGAGTSYSGGAGGGCAISDCTNSSVTALAGSSFGGAGGSSKLDLPLNSSEDKYAYTSGAGNPRGTSYWNNSKEGFDGTGGLLILYAKSVINNNLITSYGTSTDTISSSAKYFGGASGGGSINIFYTSSFSKGTIEATGGSAGENGGAGGNGCISYGSIASGSYVADIP